jgi:drug/metabolite transporter (DMT)-like permease
MRSRRTSIIPAYASGHDKSLVLKSIERHAVRVTHRRAVAAGLTVVLLWASAFPAIQRAVPQMGTVGLSFVRLAVATVALLAVGRRAKTRMPRRQDLGWIAGCGAFGMFSYQLLLNFSERHVPAGTASIIVAAAPLVSIVVARVLFHERITRFTVVGSAVALIGVAAVSAARAGLSVSESVWAVVLAMIVQGIYHPLQRPLLRTYRGIEVATYSMVAGTVMMLPLVPLAWSSLAHASGAGWAGAVYLGLVPSALGFVLWGFAASKLPTATLTSFLYLVPPVAVLIAWIWLREAPTLAELGGGLLVLAGVIIVTRGPMIVAVLRRRVRAVRGAPAGCP